MAGYLLAGYMESPSYLSFEYALSKGRDELNSKVTNIINVRSQNLLKYENESSRIRLRIHYEVLEDISKGD